MEDRHPIFLTFLVVLAGLIAGEWWVRTQTDSQPPENVHASSDNTHSEKPTTSPGSSDSNTNELIDSKLPELVDVQSFVSNTIEPLTGVTDFSWQDPFEKRFWNSSGWTFSANGMQTQSAEPTIAIFGRPYRKMMFEFRLEPIETMQSFQIQFISPSTGATTGIVFEKETIAVIAKQSSQQSLIKREPIQLKRRNPKLHTGHLYVAATGNRIIIAWNGRRVLTCKQPAAQSGRNIFVCLVSSSKRFKITDMRIEGE